MKPTKLIFLSVGVIIVCITVAGCGNQKEDSNQSKFADEDKWMFEVIQKTDQIVVFEGLPHPAFEAALFAEEKRTKETVTLHEFSFYSAPLDINDEEKKQVKRLLGEERSFRPWMGEANCGGFHPDYLVESRLGDATYQFQICFGCLEVWVHGPDKNLRYDMWGKTAKQLEALLGKHRKNRPMKESREKQAEDGKP